jgi:hypothetical protein
MAERVSITVLFFIYGSFPESNQLFSRLFSGKKCQLGGNGQIQALGVDEAVVSVLDEMQINSINRYQIDRMNEVDSAMMIMLQGKNLKK